MASIRYSTLFEKNALSALGYRLNASGSLPPISGDGVCSGEGHKYPGPESLVRKNENAMRADDEAEEETNTESVLTSAFGRAETRRESAETQTLEHTAASGHSAKRDRQGLRLGPFGTPVIIAISNDTRYLEGHVLYRPYRHRR